MLRAMPTRAFHLLDPRSAMAPGLWAAPIIPGAQAAAAALLH